MQQLSLVKDPPNLFKEQNLESLLSYVQYLTSNKNIECKTAGFDSSTLIDTHKGKSVFLVDKYVNCAIPSVSLEFLLESQNIWNYNAGLNGFTHRICVNEDVISEIFSPNIKGEHFNPYKRFQSCCSSASRSCSDLLDLAGLEPVNISELDPHDNIFLDIVCTFPSEIDMLLLNEKYRSRSVYKTSKNGKRTSQLDILEFNFIDRMNRCRKSFFNELNEIFTYKDPEQLLGLSSSLHVWSSSVPLLPNAHIHNIVPFFTYIKDRLRTPELISLAPELLESVCFVEYGEKRVVSNTKSSGSLGFNISHISTEKYKQKFIINVDKYKALRLSLSNQLKEQLGFSPCVWSDPNFPVDIDLIKKLWSKCVKSEFSEFNFEQDIVFDVHVAFISWKHKSKLLHALQYKTRPPVLDLDLFFKRFEGVDIVEGYNSINLDPVFDRLYYDLEVAVKCSNYPDINRLESLLQKLKSVTDTYSKEDIYSWLQFLSTWVTDTRVYGFWKHIKRYILDPEHELLVEQSICPICNGVISTIRNVKFCMVDSVIVRSRNRFSIFNVSLDGG